MKKYYCIKQGIAFKTRFVYFLCIIISQSISSLLFLDIDVVDGLHRVQPIAGLPQQPPHVLLAAGEDLAHVVHLDVQHADVHLVERDGLGKNRT